MPWLELPPQPVIQQLRSHSVVKLPADRPYGGPDQIEIWSGRASIEASTQTYRFDDGVVAKYGLTVLKADHLVVVTRGNLLLDATDAVQLVDPLFEIKSSHLALNYDGAGRHGSITDTNMRIGRATIRAKSVTIEPKEWVFTDAWGTSCYDTPRLYAIRARSVVIHPGDEAIARSASLDVLGKHIITLPERSVNLDPDATSTNLPVLGYRTGAGVGLDWNNVFPLSTTSKVSFGSSYYHSFAPSYNVVYTKSLIPAENGLKVPTPQSDVQRRFGYAYNERVESADPDSDLKFLRRVRQAVSVGASLNETSTASTSNVPFTKLGDFAYETSGPVRAGGYLLTSRIQFAREANTAVHPRAVIRGTYSPGHAKPSKQTFLMPRIEYGGFFGVSTYSWVQADLGFAKVVNKHLTWGVNGFMSTSTGVPQFSFDQLIARNGVDGRVDLHFGGTNISVLEKWSATGHWFEPEFRVSQVAGCVEPFLIYHRFTHDFRIGVKMRMEDVFRVFKDRNEPEKSPSSVIISSADKP